MTPGMKVQKSKTLISAVSLSAYVLYGKKLWGFNFLLGLVVTSDFKHFFDYNIDQL